MQIDELEHKFLDKKVDKANYISEMYSFHDILFQYSEFIKNRDIQKTL